MEKKITVKMAPAGTGVDVIHERAQSPAASPTSPRPGL